MKKNIIVILMLPILLFGCLPGNCVEYVIENRTDKDLEMVVFLKDSVIARKNILYSDYFMEMRECSEGGRDILSYEGNDSIQIKSNGVLLKTYYPGDKGKSIFKTDTYFYGEEALDSWKLVKHKERYGRYEKYVFEITEKDLK